MDKEDMDKAIPLQLIKKKKEEPAAKAPVVEKEQKPLPSSTEDLAVTVAAFVLNSENRSADLEFGLENHNTKAVRDEILKAIKEEEKKMD